MRLSSSIVTSSRSSRAKGRDEPLPAEFQGIERGQGEGRIEHRGLGDGAAVGADGHAPAPEAQPVLEAHPVDDDHRRADSWANALASVS